MAKRFFWRILVMSFTVSALAIMIGSFALVPSHLLSSVKQRLITERLNLQSHMAVPEGSRDTLLISKELNHKFDLIDYARDNEFLVSQEIIKKIVSHKTNEIRITQIAFSEENTGVREASIRGNALTRDGLLFFSRSLESEPAFSNVNLPISNFIRGTNIQFFITLTPASSANIDE